MRRTGACVFVGLALLLCASSAQAATVTLGHLFTPAGICSGAGTVLITSEATGTYPVPAAGVITSWSFQEAGSTIPGLKLKVGRNAGGLNYTITAEALAGTQTMNSVNTYPASVPVQAGDLIGFSFTGALDVPCANAGASDAVALVAGDQAPGTTTTYSGSGSSVPLSVQITLQPGVGSLSPSVGLATGGTQVAITGHDFNGATAVSFGGVPAATFHVNSDTSITAVSPAGTVGAVDVRVTTPGGQSPTTSGDQFTYAPAPLVSLISPSSGPRTGGTKVSIAGVHFTGANAVHFGGASATSFTVVSDTLITAVAPANRAGSVDITVVTGTGGQSVTSAADQFKFVQVCVVPKLKGKTLKAARKALMNAHCSLGGVLPKGQTTGTAKHQSRKRGKILPAGTKVNITLG